MAPKTIQPITPPEQRPDPPAEGMRWMATWADNGTLAGEGWVPADTKNTQQAILAALNEQDRLAAEQAAATAEAELEAARNRSEGSDGVAALASLTSRLDGIEAELRDLADGTPPTEEHLLLLAKDLARAQLSVPTVNAVTEAAVTRIEGLVQQVQNRLDGLATAQDTYAAEAGAVLENVRVSATEIAAKAELQVQQAIARRITALRAEVSEMRGPRGPQGAAGAGIAAGSGVPVGVNATMDSLQRPAIGGDLYIDGSNPGRPVWRWNGAEWAKGFNLRSTEFVSPSIVSQQNLTSSVQTVIKAGASSGGGTLDLLRDKVPAVPELLTRATLVDVNGNPLGMPVGFTGALQLQNAADYLRFDFTITRSPVGPDTGLQPHDLDFSPAAANWDVQLQLQRDPATQTLELLIFGGGGAVGADIAGSITPIRLQP